MVFHYTNFVVETNAWWLKRIRPLWMSTAALVIGLATFRYGYFHKIQTNAERRLSPEIQQEYADLNKRHWGYNQYYEPKLYSSNRLNTYIKIFLYITFYREMYILKFNKENFQLNSTKYQTQGSAIKNLNIKLILLIFNLAKIIFLLA